MSKNKLGYKRNSPYKNNPFIDIESNSITMQDVDKMLLLQPDGDPPVVAPPNSGEYYFPNSTKVRETPMQSGGFVSKWLGLYQDGGPIPLDLNKLSKEEYAKLYSEGRVATYDKQSNAYQPPVLPEATVSAKAPKSFGDFFDRYGKKKTAETTSLAQAMFAAPAEYLMGLPQAATTYLLDSEKNLEPSKALGIENKWGAIAADMILDPTNLVGAGLAKSAVKTGRSLKNVGNAVSKSSANSAGAVINSNIARAVKNSKQLAEEISGEILQGRSNRKAIQEGNQWLQDWIQHPETQEKIKRDLNNWESTEIEKVKSLVEESLVPFKGTLKEGEASDILDKAVNWIPVDKKLMEKQSLEFKPNTKEYPLLKQVDENLQNYLNVFDKNTTLDNIHTGNAGVSYRHGYAPDHIESIEAGILPTPSRFGSWASRSARIPQNNRTSTVIHEGTHDWVPEETFSKSGLRNIATQDLSANQRQQLSTWSDLRSRGETPDTQMGSFQANQAYLSDPTEQHARIMELRKHFGLHPGNVISEGDAESMMRQIAQWRTPVDPNFLNTVNNNPKNLADRFNKFWAAAPLIAAGASQAEYQKGGQVNIQKAGSITFDSNTAKNNNGVLTVTDLETKKPVQVVRNTNGTYKLFEGTVPTEEEYAKNFYTNFIQSPQYNEINKTKTKAQLTDELKKERPDLFTPEKANLLAAYAQGMDWDKASEFEKNKQDEINQVKGTTVKYGSSPEKKGSRYKRADNTVYVDTKADKQFDPIDILSHELSHSKSSLPGMMGRNFSEKYRVSTISELMNPSTKGHDSDPDEYKADINALRFKLSRDGYYDPLHNPFTREVLERAKSDKVFQKNELFKRALKNSKNEESLIEALNSIVQNNKDNVTVAKSGGQVNNFISKWLT